MRKDWRALRRVSGAVCGSAGEWCRERPGSLVGCAAGPRRTTKRRPHCPGKSHCPPAPEVLSVAIWRLPVRVVDACVAPARSAYLAGPGSPCCIGTQMIRELEKKGVIWGHLLLLGLQSLLYVAVGFLLCDLLHEVLQGTHFHFGFGCNKHTVKTNSNKHMQ